MDLTQQTQYWIADPGWTGLDVASKWGHCSWKQLCHLIGPSHCSPEPCLLLRWCQTYFEREVGRGWAPKILLFLESVGSSDNQATDALTYQGGSNVYSCVALKGLLNWCLVKRLMGALGRAPQMNFLIISLDFILSSKISIKAGAQCSLF